MCAAALLTEIGCIFPALMFMCVGVSTGKRYNNKIVRNMKKLSKWIKFILSIYISKSFYLYNGINELVYIYQ